MKKFFLQTLFLVLFSATFVFEAVALEGTVLSVKGKVEIQKGDEWIPVNPGDSIPTGTIISTGFKSEAIIKVKESKFTLTALTRITVEQLSSTPAKDNTQLYLDSGTVKFDVKKAENKKVGFKVRSPVATASVRGTVGDFRSDGLLVVHEGLVSYGPAETKSAEVLTVKEENVENKDEDPNKKLDSNSTENSTTETNTEKQEFIPKDDESTALTSTEAVSGKKETPVFAGQQTKTNSITGTTQKPQSIKEKETKQTGNGTSSISQTESVSIGTFGTQIPQEPSFENKKSIISVTINWD